MEKTVLDIKKKSTSVESSTTYEVNSINSLFEAIEHELTINPLCEVIKIKKNDNLNIRDLMNKCGFEQGINYLNNSKNNVELLRFRCYSRWVYFLGDKPVHFDSACSGTDTPSHQSTWASELYKSLKFDSFKKISF